MNIALSATTNLGTPKNWEKNEQAFTGDDLIDAYLSGKESGRNEEKRILLKQLKENINSAAELSEKLYLAVYDKQIKLKSIHLRADNISKYFALFITDKKDFLSDEFREVYTIARSIKNEAETDDFYISFSFMPDNGDVNEHCLVSDGFFLKYEKK